MELSLRDATSVAIGFAACILYRFATTAINRWTAKFDRHVEKTQRLVNAVHESKDLTEPESEHETLHKYHRERKGSSHGTMLYFVVGALVVVCALALNAFRLGRSLQGPGESEVESVAGHLDEQCVNCTDVSLSPETPVNFRSVKLTRQVIPLQKVDGRLRFKSAYWGNINIGTPAVEFKAVFDTGSGHVILPSAFCHSTTCRRHKRYRRGASTTAKDIDHDGTVISSASPRDQLTVKFGKGTIDGVFMEDVVCFGAETATSVASSDVSQFVKDGCSTMRIVAATEMSEDPFNSFDFDGIVGLTLQPLSQTPEFNFMNMMSRSVFDGNGMFSIHLATEAEEKSEIMFGGWRRSHISGSRIFWNPVIMPESGHWMLNVKSIRVDGEELDICKEGCHGVADTGTSLLAVPGAAFSPLFTRMIHEVSEDHCTGPGPILEIELDNFVVSLGPPDYARLDPKARPSDISEAKHVCKPMLMVMDLPAPLGPKLFILGEPVLRRFYTVYDSKQMRIGFASGARKG